MVLTKPGAGVLELCEREKPVALPGDVLVKVRACGVCRTDLHLVAGELPDAGVPRVPGHEIVGVVAETGEGVSGLSVGDRVGIPWLGYACGACAFCLTGRENLCPSARFTGYQRDGGYADYAVVDARFAFKLPAHYGDVEAAPLLCAGLIGYRSYRMTEGSRRLGLYGFGAAAHIIAQVAVNDGRDVYAFTKEDDEKGRAFARRLGAVWAGPSTEAPPEPLDAAIIFAPVGGLVPEALRRTAPGGVVVCAGIHMSDIPSFPYRLLWQERVLRSVANLTRADAHEFLTVAGNMAIETSVVAYELQNANQALDDVRAGLVEGAAVLVP
jgi:propanol-preferring alcohol dehydrogenase